MSSTLFIVGTPIGNLGDITLRALETLKNVDFVYAEDTRVTRNLCTRHGVTTPLRSYRESQPRPQLERTIVEILSLLEDDKTIALVSDAGTPGVSDPGDYLVSRVRAAGHKVVPIPGPSALAAILSVAGLGVQHPLFEGFLPHKKGRHTRLVQLETALLSNLTDGIVLYESPNRIVNLLAELLEWKGECRVCLGRELTKQFEEVLCGSLVQIHEELSNRKDIKGEIVLLVTHV
jgi:16S rRNA (cytidine1402-2'-O)-methyltransferase